MANEMRLISADRFCDFVDENCTDRHAALWKELIRRQPTVDARPVVHGQWLDGCAIHNGKEVYKSIDCSVCEEVFKIESHDREYWKKRFKNCPFCGSQMDGGDGE